MGLREKILSAMWSDPDREWGFDELLSTVSPDELDNSARSTVSRMIESREIVLTETCDLCLPHAVGEPPVNTLIVYGNCVIAYNLSDTIIERLSGWTRKKALEILERWGWEMTHSYTDIFKGRFCEIIVVAPIFKGGSVDYKSVIVSN